MLREIKEAEAIGKFVPPGFSPEAVLCLVASTSREGRPSGTAVMISPHCGLTARHVVDDYFDMTSNPGDELSILGRSGFSPKHQNRDWRFNQVVRIDQSDIALLVLADQQPPIFGLAYPQINLVPPEVGEVIVAMGYHSSTITLSGDSAGPVRIWEDRPTISRGKILEVHHQARDKVLMPHPCFVADCDVRGGMSGGPVFDEKGFVRGIISSSISPMDDDLHATTAQSVWSSLILPIGNTRLCKAFGYGKSLYEAVLRGKVAATGVERLKPSFRADGSLENLSLLEK